MEMSQKSTCRYAAEYLVSNQKPVINATETEKERQKDNNYQINTREIRNK